MRKRLNLCQPKSVALCGLISRLVRPNQSLCTVSVTVLLCGQRDRTWSITFLIDRRLPFCWSARLNSLATSWLMPALSANSALCAAAAMNRRCLADLLGTMPRLEPLNGRSYRL